MRECLLITSLALQDTVTTAIIGGGGKSSLMAALGQEYALRGDTAVMTTTTHIRPPERDYYMGDDPAVLGDLLMNHPAVLSNMLMSRRLMTVGIPMEDRRLGATPLLEQLPELADHVIIEADGTKGLPLKVPNDREPVIPAFADAVVAVAGLSALGNPLGEVCHRPELAVLRFGFSPEQKVTPEMMAMLLSSPLAQRKNVGNRPYAVLLNQRDVVPAALTELTAGLLLQNGVDRVVAAALRHSPGEYEVWTR